MARLPMSMLVAAAAAALLLAPAEHPDIALVNNVQSETDGLNPVLKYAYTLAQRDAAAQGVPLGITSGHRSWAEQQTLWQQGIAEYGSPQAARRWVLPPEDSAHVKGLAIDVHPIEGARWLERNGNKYGLCRRYENEWWHFEIATLPYLPCPAMLPDASHSS